MSTMRKIFPSEQHVAAVDDATGLMWAADDVTVDGVTFAEAEKAVANMNLLGHTDWRLPTIQELLTCVDYTRHDPAANTDLHRVKSAWCWTSTPTAWSASARWVVHFYNGYGSSHDFDGGARVRAVRSVRAADKAGAA